MKKHHFTSLGSFCLLAALAFVLAGCGASASTYGSSAGYYKVGKPYRVKGQTYHPTADYSYDRTGIASWYGDDFHNLKTANGEVFDKNALTAAHKTLPLPCMARVTNLDNGRSIVVRVNDRGPFVAGRIIDLSQRAAQLLGFERQGTAKVRVQVLASESHQVAQGLPGYSGQSQEPIKPILISAPQRASYASLPVEEETLESQVISDDLFVETPSRPEPEYTQLPVTGGTDIYIQAGAFTLQENALRLKDQLSIIGTTNISEAVINGITFYRVRLGPIDNVAEADRLLQKVLDYGIDGARILVD